MELAVDRVGALLDQLDASLEFAYERLEGLGDAEWLWEPATPCWSVRRRGEAPTSQAFGPGEWVLDTEGGPPAPGVRSIAWLVSHVTAGVAGRWEWTMGGRAIAPDQLVEFTPSAADGLQLLASWCDRWRDGVRSLTAEQLDLPGYGAYPLGLDAELPFLGIVWWVNREVIHHLAEAAALRDLYALRSR